MEFVRSKKVIRPLAARVILVRPEYSMNVGMAARVCKNFSVTDLAFVNPKCKIGFEAFKYAKHSKEILENAKFFPTLQSAVKGFDLVIGTTGVIRRFTNSLKMCVPLPLLHQLVRGKKVAFVFGSEGTGLSENDFQQCSVVTHIPAEKAHPVLNLSHSVAVVLYSVYFSHKNKTLYKEAASSDKVYLNNLFCQIVDKLEKETLPKLRNSGKAKNAFRRVLARAKVADIEVNILLGVFARIRKALFQRSR